MVCPSGHTRPLPELGSLPEKVAVLFASGVNGDGRPALCPVRMEPRERYPAELPPNWVTMTREEYRAHLEVTRDDFEIWDRDRTRDVSVPPGSSSG